MDVPRVRTARRGPTLTPAAREGLQALAEVQEVQSKGFYSLGSQAVALKEALQQECRDAKQREYARYGRVKRAQREERMEVANANRHAQKLVLAGCRYAAAQKEVRRHERVARQAAEQRALREDTVAARAAVQEMRQVRSMQNRQQLTKALYETQYEAAMGEHRNAVEGLRRRLGYKLQRRDDESRREATPEPPLAAVARQRMVESAHRFATDAANVYTEAWDVLTAEERQRRRAQPVPPTTFSPQRRADGTRHRIRDPVDSPAVASQVDGFDMEEGAEERLRHQGEEGELGLEAAAPSISVVEPETAERPPEGDAPPAERPRMSSADMAELHDGPMSPQTRGG